MLINHVQLKIFVSITSLNDLNKEIVLQYANAKPFQKMVLFCLDSNLTKKSEWSKEVNSSSANKIKSGNKCRWVIWWVDFYHLIICLVWL
jgi:hypothetical protein